MGFERLCGALQWYSKHARLFNIQQKVGVFLNTSLSSPSPPSVRVFQVSVAVRRGLCTSTRPIKDVILFEHDKTGFARLLALFSGGQFVFWTYLAHFAYTGLRDTGGAQEQTKQNAPTSTALAGMWSFEMNLGSNTWRYGFTLGCLTIGAGILALGALFCRRSVSQVFLHQGGRMVTVSTQSPLGVGRGRKITVPLSEVACYAHRQESPSFIPLKIKGHRFFFLLDKSGTVTNNRQFDLTVGAFRKFK
ncbi:transmembrane protein 223 [Aulostomus maculatus]